MCKFYLKMEGRGSQPLFIIKQDSPVIEVPCIGVSPFYSTVNDYYLLERVGRKVVPDYINFQLAIFFTAPCEIGPLVIFTWIECMHSEP